MALNAASVAEARICVAASSWQPSATSSRASCVGARNGRLTGRAADQLPGAPPTGSCRQRSGTDRSSTVSAYSSTTPLHRKSPEKRRIDPIAPGRAQQRVFSQRNQVCCKHSERFVPLTCQHDPLTSTTQIAAVFPTSEHLRTRAGLADRSAAPRSQKSDLRRHATSGESKSEK